MKLLIVIVSIISLFACGGNQGAQKAESRMSDTTETVSDNTEIISNDYTILREDDRRSFKNFDILIDSSSTIANALVTTNIFKIKECGTTPCNVVGVWTSKRAFSLWENRSDNAKWRKKNWPFLCEHYIGEYNATVGEINMYPFLDSDYRRWGGKQKRPAMHSFSIK